MLGRPVVEVDAVDDVSHLVRIITNRRREAPPALVRRDLPRVSRRHSHHLGRVLDASLEDVHARALLRIVQEKRPSVIIRQTQGATRHQSGFALVRDVVHHEDGPRESELEVILVERAKVNGQKCGVPVVGDVQQRFVAVGNPRRARATPPRCQPARAKRHATRRPWWTRCRSGRPRRRSTDVRRTRGRRRRGARGSNAPPCRCRTR